MPTLLTKEVNEDASVEALLFLPLILILTWGMALVSIALTQRSRTEQAAWVYGTALTHPGSSKQSAEIMSRETAGVSEEEFQIRSRADRSGWVNLARNTLADLPLGFKGALGLYAPKTHSLQIQKPFPSGLRDLERSDRGEMKYDVEFQTHGDSFYSSRIIRQALWQEAMAEAGFGVLPLQLLGVEELMSVVGINLGGPARDILQRWGR